MQTGYNSVKKGKWRVTANDKEKADVLDRLFSSVFTTENTQSMPTTTPGEKSNGTFLSDMCITEEAVKLKLKSLNTNKTPGVDTLHPKVLKELGDVLALPLSIVFNKSIEEGKIPEEWKKANVTAIFKKGDKSNPNNYRPVSLTSVVCKILETFIRDPMQNFLESQNLYSKCQHGFRRGKSCTSQLLEVMEDFTTLLDRGENFDTIYLDFKKAFDSVPHKRLLKKMEMYGVTGNLLAWTEDFLSNRTQTVKVGDAESKSSPVISGIPQGSVLGPTLFTIFINDLPECIESACKVFADDTKIYNSTSNRQKLQQDLNNVQAWSELWQLPFNTSKCKCLHYGNKNPEFDYYLNNTKVSNCEEEKDLGVTFDKTLKFRTHISNVTKKANQVLGLIKRNFKFLDETSLTKLYKALVRPHLEYAQSVWSPHFRTDKKTIESVQRRATKLISQLKNLSYEERLKALDLPSLEYRRLRGDLIQMYNLLSSNSDNYKYFFELNKNDRTRGHNLKLVQHHCKLDSRKYSFSMRAISTWNNLNYNVVNAKNVNTFKNLLDYDLKHLKYVSNEFY